MAIKRVQGNKSVVVDLGVPNKKQELFYQSRTTYTCYGGARGGGKTHAIRVKACGGALEWSGIKILVLRRKFTDLEDNHINPLKRMISPQLAEYNATTHVMTFANGSTIKFAHYNYEKTEESFQGQEYDWIFLDEATQFTEQQFRTLGGCLRGVNDIPKRFYLSCNPGGVGHRWVKRLFIDGNYKRYPSDPSRDENPEDYTFIFASVDDNVAMLEKSPQYAHMLDHLPDKLYRAHRFGDWNALSGCYFDEFNEATHVIDPFKIPNHWRKYRVFDYGLDMFACYWIAVDDNDISYVYREFCQSNLIVREACEQIHDNTGIGENISITFAPPDMWNRQKDTGKSMAEIFSQCDVPIVKAPNDRVQGHMQIKDVLSVDSKTQKSKLYIFRNCKSLIEDIACIQADETNPNDCAKEPHDITHTVDALRYYCISRTLPAFEVTRKNDFKTRLAMAYNEIDYDEEDYENTMCGGEISPSYISA